MKTTYILLLAAVTLGLASCKKEFDSPPANTIPTGHIITLDSLRNMYQGINISFDQDYSVYGVVTADEVDGNLYKNIYVQSGSAAINMRLLNSGGVYIGDSIRIYLKGTVLSKYNGMLQLDSVDVDKNIIKQATNIHVEPLDVNINDITPALQARLVRINNVEFETSELSATWADAINQFSANRTLTDCIGNTTIVRTSGYANYAGLRLPQGNGSIVAVVGQFNTDMQLYVRTLGEVNMTGVRCTGNPPLLFKGFEDNSATSGGWSMFKVLGNTNFTTNGAGSGHSGSYYIQCTNYLGTPGSYDNCDTWYISPSVNLASASNPVFTFMNACNYSGPIIEVKVSSNYTGGNPNTATWTTITPPVVGGGVTQGLSNGSWSWVSSGNISLSSFIGQSNVRIAFRYVAPSSGKTWELDDITIAEL